MFILYDIWWYGWYWLLFGAIAFCCARFLGGGGILLGTFLLAIILLWMDLNWVLDDMRHHPENERDADFVFMLGVLIRTIVFTVLLQPVRYLGTYLRERHETGRLSQNPT